MNHILQRRLVKVRQLLYKNKLDAYVISTRDEYSANCIRESTARLKYLTGFSGSNAILLVTSKYALFFTDGRYLEQAQIELDTSIFDIFHLRLLVQDFDFNKYLHSNAKIGLGSQIFLSIMVDRYFPKFNIHPLEEDLTDIVLTSDIEFQKSLILQKIHFYFYDEKYSGLSAKQKIKQCRDFIRDHNAQALLLADSENISWLLNIRSNAYNHFPIIRSNFLLVTHSNIYLSVDSDDFNAQFYKTLPGVTVLKSNTIRETLYSLQGEILYDKTELTLHLQEILKQTNSRAVANPCTLWKACKNKVEIQNFIDIHILDSISMCEFLYYIKNNDMSIYNEYALSQQLQKLRGRHSSYIQDSFQYIVGYKENGAIIHYHPDINTSKQIIGHGLLLIDSGAHYWGGSTDITRTILIGNATPKQKEMYTRVLKGHIQLNMLRFPKNTTGASIDVLARQYLWNINKDYEHSTGHGVGNCLNIHEGPQAISAYNHTSLSEYMIVSNEPGYYESQEFGIRIENLMYVSTQQENDNFYQFNVLNLVPYESDLINCNLLSNEEKNYIVNYYIEIKNIILPHLSDSARQWWFNKIEQMIDLLQN